MISQDNVLKLLKDLKEAAEHITLSLTHIFNLSIKSGRVPKEINLLKVVPLYKKGSKLE